MAAVLLEHVSKAFKGAKGQRISAVNDFSLAVGEGEFIAVLGPSGCGKTTLLRLIAGLDQLDAGTVSIDGRIVNSVQPKDRDIAIVFQNYALYPHMSVYDNLSFPLKLRKSPKPQIHESVRETVALLGIGELLERKPESLSGGQRQRVALGRAIVQRPKVFLFDEPLSNLDAKLRVQMRTEIARLHRRLGSTMIYVTHDQGEALAMGDRIVVMNDGAVQQVATALELYRHPATMFVAEFLGSPAMNLFEGTLLAKNGAWLFQARPENFCVSIEPTQEQIKSLQPFHDRAIVLGCRPEDVSISEGSRSTVCAVVELVELLGPESIVQLRIASSPCAVRVRGASRLAVGQKLMLKFDFAKAHFFDPQTERRIV